MRRLPEAPAGRARAAFAVVAVLVAVTVLAVVTAPAWAAKDVTLVIDGKASKKKTTAGTVGVLLEQASIRVSKGDVVSEPLSAPLEDGTTVIVRRAVPVTLKLSRGAVAMRVVGNAVADALVAAGLDPATVKVDPPASAPLESGMVISATDVFLRLSQEETDVPFSQNVMQDPTMALGQRKVLVEGSPGRSLRIYEIMVVGGKPGKPVLRAARLVKKPVDRVVALGVKRSDSTRVAVSRKAASPVRPPSAGKRLKVVATAYAPGHGAGWRTATGARAGYGIIAVDPRVIPLGTRMYVPGYGYGVAADTGGAIKGNRIDVCFDRGGAVTRAWGRRTVTIVILR